MEYKIEKEVVYKVAVDTTNQKKKLRKQLNIEKSLKKMMILKHLLE